MDKNLQKKLFEKYPLVFADRGTDNETPFTYLGIECGNGWFRVLDNLCANVESKIRSWQNDNPEIKEKHPRVSQVKEQFGGLRFYMDYPNKCQEALYNEIREIIGPFEKESYKICEFCGKDGEARKNIGWVLTLCDNCYEKRKNNSSGDKNDRL